MSEPGGRRSTEGSGSEPEDVLRAKYLDYCSAQVADLLLLLSPDEIYVLARDAARESEVKDLPYEDIVKLATTRISSRLVLPPFDVWVEDYREHADYYDRYLMGFWKSEVEPASES